MPQKYAALTYDGTNNLGDEIQTLAAMQFLPQVDAWVHRERLDEFVADSAHKIILNGWFLHRPEHWPPSKSLRPLIISFHLTRDAYPVYNERMIVPSSTVLSPDGLEYLKGYEPIGARDLDTLCQLREAGVRAYFSGCLTLTLRRPPVESEPDKVYAVSVSDEVFDHFSKHCDVPIIRMTHYDGESVGNERFDRASALLRKYAAARAVITGRLHCALPCLAMGTPVLFVETAKDSYRFDGLRDLLPRFTETQILDHRYQFDLLSPPPNGAKWQALRNELEMRCRDFVGS
jgi:hypothetical protein